MTKLNEIENAQARLVDLDAEVEELRAYITEYTGYLKLKFETQRKLLRRICELIDESEDA